MKITIKQLRQLVKEELEKSLEEELWGSQMTSREKEKEDEKLKNAPKDLPDFGIHGKGKKIK